MAVPCNNLEAQVYTIWREMLGGAVVDPDENFFDAGGTSLLASRLAARLRSQVSPSITAQDILHFPTVRALSQHLCRPLAASGSATPDPRAMRQQAALRQLRQAHAVRKGVQGA